MADPDLAPDTIEEMPEDGQERKRRRWPLLLLLLLLLLLCTVTSVVDVLINRNPDEARFIARNIECLQCHTELIPDFDKPQYTARSCCASALFATPPTARTSSAPSCPVDRARCTFQQYSSVLRYLPLRFVFGVWDSFNGVERTDDGVSF